MGLLHGVVEKERAFFMAADVLLRLRRKSSAMSSSTHSRRSSFLKADSWDAIIDRVVVSVMPHHGAELRLSRPVGSPSKFFA